MLARASAALEGFRVARHGLTARGRNSDAAWRRIAIDRYLPGVLQQQPALEQVVQLLAASRRGCA